MCTCANTYVMPRHLLASHVILASLDMLLNPMLNGWLKSWGGLLSSNPLAAEKQERPGYYQKRA